MSKLAIFGGTPVNPQGHSRWPIITEDDKKAILEVCDSKVLWGNNAPQVKALEKEWAEYIGTNYALSCNSGTAGLHMAVAACDIGPGDEVITPSLTFVATQLCVLQNNAIPVFVDVDPRTFNIDYTKIEEKITPRTKAIIAVDLHGQPADYDEINAIAKKHNLKVIADCAQSHGATYKGRKAGTLSDLAMFSLNGLKNLQCGDGGLVSTSDPELLAKADKCRLFGEEIVPGVPRKYDSCGIGWCYRMTEWQAAFTRSRLKLLTAENAVRQENAHYLISLLEGIKGVIPPYIKPDNTSVFHHFRIRLDPKALGIDMEPRLFRAKVQKALNAEGVENSRWQTRPVQLQTLFIERSGYGKGCPWTCPYGKGTEVTYGPEDYAVTKAVLDDSLVLVDPIYPPNGKDLMDRYAEGFNKVFENIDEVLKIDVPADDIWLRD